MKIPNFKSDNFGPVYVHVVGTISDIKLILTMMVLSYSKFSDEVSRYSVASASEYKFTALRE